MASDDAHVQDELFIPADTVREAVERIYGLTGRAPGTTRGEKRALVALRDALNLDVDTVRTNAVMGAELAEALHVDWQASRYTVRNTVNVAGLNALLEGAAAARRLGSLRRLRDEVPPSLDGPEWAGFQPAHSKIEAVTRIAALTGAPAEWLGPGAKEHKSVFLNLADNVFPGHGEIDRSSKSRLGASLAALFGVRWTDECHSTGETISLTGLNTVLAGAERYLDRLGSTVADVLTTPAHEGRALASALLAKMPVQWDGRSAVTWLQKHGLRGAFDNEWQGFYGEQVAKLYLARAFTPKDVPPVVRYGSTTFDYALNYVWDIKVHTESRVGERDKASDAMILNDERAVRACVAEQGLGFLVLSGTARMDVDGEFVTWHRAFKDRNRRRAAAASNSGGSRTRKAAFQVRYVEAFFVPDTESLEAAIVAGALKVRPIGRQAPKEVGADGAARADKFQMNMVHARQEIQVASHEWPQGRSTDS